MKLMFTGALIATTGLSAGAVAGFLSGFVFAAMIMTDDVSEA